MRAVSGPQGAPLSREKHRAVQQTRVCGRCRPTRVTNFGRDGPAPAQPAARRPSPPLSGSGSAARRGAVSSSRAGIFHVGVVDLGWSGRTVTCRARSVPPDRGFPQRGTGSTRTPAPAAAEVCPSAGGREARLNEGKQPQACGQRGIHQGAGIKSCGGPSGSGALQGARRQLPVQGFFCRETASCTCVLVWHWDSTFSREWNETTNSFCLWSKPLSMKQDPTSDQLIIPNKRCVIPIIYVSLQPKYLDLVLIQDGSKLLYITLAGSKGKLPMKGSLQHCLLKYIQDKTHPGIARWREEAGAR
ncbi:uncharacterized protein LOC127059474 [Serinus canaria]|uniref:uncharacterized protein LOC127059474 n=1 Tax=Serinus canaria TaxID=9135 RepID=UPI0021CCA33F|nr:uncharacterized protein LOC127059474 [Serinus canaria]